MDLKNTCLGFREAALYLDQIWLTDFLEAALPEEMNFSDSTLTPIHAPWFQDFLNHPQINSLLIGAVYFRFLCEASNSMDLDSGLLDLICNRCIQFMQEKWMQDDSAVKAFRRFWSILLHPCWKNAGNLPEPVDLLADTASSYLRSLAVSQKNKLKDELDADFIPLCDSYEKTRKEYQKKIHDLYRTGFIYLLGEYPFNGFYIPPTLESPSNNISFHSRLSWKNIFERNNIIYVIGTPGSGKSLFLQNILNNYAQLNFFFSQDYLVICCDLKTFYTNGDSNKKSIPDFLQETIINAVGMDTQEISLDFILYHIRLGRCLVLLDALDEVPKGKRQALHKKAATYFKTAHPNNKVCITSRARGFLPQEDITVLKIPALTGEDIEAYIDRMIRLGKFKPQDKKTFMQRAQVLIHKRFLNSFLVLSLLVNIYKAEKELPENKIDLYKKCFEYIAKKREEEKAKISYDWTAIGPMLKDSTFINLAVLGAPNNANISRDKIEAMLLELYKNKYMDEAAAEHAIGQFLEFCSARTELFVLSNTNVEDRYRFFHRSFFEYFYSRYIAQQPSIEEMYRLMIQFDIDSEVFELTVALVKEENEQKYQALIDYIFSQINVEFNLAQPKFAAFSILTLSMQVIDDAQYQKRYFNVIMERPNLMDSKKVQEINQWLIAGNLLPTLDHFPEEAKRFCQIYHDRYILSVLDSMDMRRIIPQYIPSDTDENPEVPVHSATGFEIPLELLIYSPPFYVRAYPAEAANTLQDEVLHWENSQILAFLKKYPGNNRKRRRNFNDLMKLGPEARERLWRDLTGRALPESEPDA